MMGREARALFSELHTISDPLKWAERAGYSFSHIDYPFELAELTCPEGSVEFKSISNAVDLIKKIESAAPILIHATDVTVIVWNWGGDESHKRHYRYFLVSTNGDLLCELPDNADYWLKFFPFLEQTSDHVYDLSSIDNIDCYEITEPHFFAAGSMHFGHWVADTLPLIILGSELADHHILTTQLNDNASFILKRYMKKATINLSQIDMSHNQLKRFLFRELKLISNLGPRRKNKILRDFSPERDICPRISGNGLCYLLRGTVDGVTRLKNEDEILRLCEQYHVDVIDPATTRFLRSEGIFRRYHTFIFLNSSVNTNFNVLAADNSRAVNFLSDSHLSTDLSVVLGSSVYLASRLKDMQFGLAKSLDGSQSLAGEVEIPIDILRTYLVESLQ
jgi:hypothetical protein